ncbi:MAG: hypothetical protein KIT00_06300 [Rhodospirillales bacterium]|nr:hypothetical protein [Rhodospirillales bacterium]
MAVLFFHRPCEPAEPARQSIGDDGDEARWRFGGGYADRHGAPAPRPSAHASVDDTVELAVAFFHRLCEPAVGSGYIDRHDAPAPRDDTVELAIPFFHRVCEYP